MPSNDANRPYRSLYNSKQWHRDRQWAITQASIFINGRKVPVCCKTGVYLTGGKDAPDCPIVDHKIPHRGDPVLFHDRRNLQVVSKAWHDSVKQKQENRGYTIGCDLSGRPRDPSHPWRMKPAPSQASADHLFEPRDLQPSRPSLIILCGAPGSGKSTYVRTHAKVGDIIVDMDAEADRLGIDRFTNSRADVLRLLAARNDRLKELATSDAPRAWFTMLGAKPSSRKLFADQLKPRSVVIMMTPAQECLRRIAETRPTAGPDMRQAVIKWHDQYAPRAGERVIRWDEERQTDDGPSYTIA